ncbi:Hypothetical protein CAP_4185 [Chondromyces apiculatus DSM 436]|uniref:Uncharacterized protein n=1 Tax=Chondromyces apiculatus DSM 436 TaxID=1192034 RepID=A0A017T7D1_9BACT|nr:Hypothetical protein CAP_4185 [Chondromyces apiculatus DSM 436]
MYRGALLDGGTTWSGPRPGKLASVLLLTADGEVWSTKMSPVSPEQDGRPDLERAEENGLLRAVAGAGGPAGPG